MTTTWIIDAAEDGCRISRLLHTRGYSLSQRRRWRRSARLTCNGRAADWTTTVRCGDTVVLCWEDPQPLVPWHVPVTIVYEDGDFLVADKPAGMLTHATAAERTHTLLHALQAYLNDTRTDTRPHPIHRLDRGTSGLLVIALSAAAQHDFMQRSFRDLHRTYQAVVTGCFPAPFGDIRLPIARKPGSIIEREVNLAHGQDARTYIRRLAAAPDASLLQIRLATGRTHQIRVHLSHLGYPLWGDDLYGGLRTLIDRQALHAAAISFPHPHTGRIVRVRAPLPPDMQALVEHFSLQ